MLPFKLRSVLVVILISVVTTIVNAKEVIDDDVESVSCFQQGKLILKTSSRIRNFTITDKMFLAADVNVGQLNEDHLMVYTSKHADVVCVVTLSK